MNNDKNINDVLGITGDRADEIIRLCYDKLIEVKAAKIPNPVMEVIRYMNTIGKTDEEKLLAGFIFGRIYQSQHSAWESHEGAFRAMFG
jgi:hypothetical protein